MRPACNHFEVLGLRPGRYAPDEIRAAFRRRRAVLVTRMAEAPGDGARRELDQLHAALQALGEPGRQKAALASLAESADPYERIRRMIECSLEGNLVRCSRRRAIIEEAVRLGFSEFHAHLMIAQVQFGDRKLLKVPDPPRPRRMLRVGPAAARFAAAMVLGLAMFLAMVRWLSA